MVETAGENASKGSGATSCVPLMIDGEDHYPKNTFGVTNPATGKAVWTCSGASKADAAAAADAAAKAFRAWSSTVPRHRRDILLKAAEVMKKREEELTQYHMQETGCPRDWAAFNIGVATDFMTDVAGRISNLTGVIPTTQDQDTGAFIFKEPYGVVLAVAPWNAPYILGTRAVVFPIAAGNTVVFKGSELSPRCMWAICSVLKEAGLPDGVLNFVLHAPNDAPEITEALISHPEVKKVNFTGSTPVGRIIAGLAGQYLKPVLLELGGKAPAIVWHDADLEKAAQQCALGAFLNSGQICMATERILVHKRVRAAFEKALVAATEEIFGKPQILIHGAAAEKNRKLLQDATSKGARVLHGDLNVAAGSKTQLPPFIVSGVKNDMDLYHTESFGPSVSIYEVETEEEALRLANDTEYGLSSAIFTEDLRLGLRMARGIETGAVHINSMSVHDESALPHGGCKSSGYGRFNAGSLEEWVRSKTVTYQL